MESHQCLCHSSCCVKQTHASPYWTLARSLQQFAPCLTRFWEHIVGFADKLVFARKPTPMENRCITFLYIIVGQSCPHQILMRATLHHLNKLANRSQNAEDREVSYAMRLLQRGNSVSNGLDDEERPSMPPEEFERCKNLAWDLNISEGAGTLTALNCCWALLRLLEFLQDLITRKEIDVRFKFIWRSIEFIFLLGVLFPLARTMREPRTLLYFPILAMYFVYVVLIGLPPLTFSCEELAANLQKFNSTNREDLNDRLHHSDCGLQGETLVQVMMAWLMLTPRVMPTMTLTMRWAKHS
eukprot:s840_g8.t3